MNRLPLRRSICKTAVAPVLCCAIMALAACSSTQDVLEPAALVSPQAAQPAQTPFPVAVPGAQTAAISSNARIRFAPLVGATSEAATPLSARISTRATARGISLAGADDSSATHIMKGYFSAISEGGQTTVIYVWDVLDPAGNRVHRIQGRSQAQGSGQGWQGVPQQTMETIADQTVDELASWLGTQRG